MPNYLKHFPIKILLVWLASTGLLPLPLFSQQNSTAREIAEDFEHYQQNNLQENIYVHTDKDFYLAGEILWFKLYTVDAFFQRPLDMSKLAYVEVLDQAGKPVLQAKIALQSGEGNGSFYLPATLGSGHYQLRAYTNWMKNAGPESFFKKNITVINSQKIYIPPVQKEVRKYDLQFFPEGGDMVAGIRNKLAFKVTDQFGKGIDFTGYVLDELQDTVAKFRSLKFGMGNLLFTPDPSHTYRGVIQLPDSTLLTRELPESLTRGYAMQVTEAGADSLKVAIQSREEPDDAVYLVVQSHDLLKQLLESRLKNGTTEFYLDRSILGDGISQITLFSAAKVPVCERLCFRKPAHWLNISLKTDQETYQIRKKVTLSLETTGENGDRKAADLSMAVYRLDSLQRRDPSTIVSYLWLAADLKGYIESPEYYFSGPEAAAAADNLMLTQGWRRFRWADVLAQRFPNPEFPPEYQGPIITGKVINTATGQPQSGIPAYLSIPGKVSQFIPSLSDSSGKVKFEAKNYYSQQEIIVQQAPDDSIYRTDITDPFYQNYPVPLMPPFQLPAQNPVTLLNQHIGMEVQNIYLGDKLRSFDTPAIDTTAFYLPDESYQLDDYTRFTTMEEVLREYVQQILVHIRKSHYHIDVFDVPENLVFHTDPLILLDGVPIFNVDKFIGIDPLKVKSLDVVKKRYFLGGFQFDGIISCKTYRGDLANYQLNPHATVLDFGSIQPQREFYAPRYETTGEAADHLPDFRNLLFWSPDIRTGVQGAGVHDFYTSDLAGDYIIVVQGLTVDGRAGYQYQTIRVTR